MPLLSVIVPVYNVESYLEQCVDSILKQSFTDFELILVDDGSPDRCPQLCDSYAEKDPRVKVLHKGNGGLVSARKAGLRASVGTYVTYVDGDDWIEPDMYEVLLTEAIEQDADMVMSGLLHDDGKHTTPVGANLSAGVYKNERLKELYAKALYIGKFYDFGMHPSLCNKVIKRSVLLKKQLQVDDSITMGEDAAVTFPVLLEASCVVINNQFFPYHYRMLEHSMSHAYDSHYFEGIQKLLEKLRNDFKEKDCEELLEELNYYTLFLVKMGLDRELSRNNPASIIQKMNKVKEVIRIFKLEYIVSVIDWNDFNNKNRKQLLRLSGQGGSYVIHHYIQRLVIGIKRRMKGVYECCQLWIARK